MSVHSRTFLWTATLAVVATLIAMLVAGSGASRSVRMATVALSFPFVSFAAMYYGVVIGLTRPPLGVDTR